MRKLRKVAVLGLATAVAAIGLAACGGGGDGGGGGQEGGTATVLMGTAPDYLDPQEMYTTQGYEPGWITWTGLLTYKHEDGQAGTELIPGLATDLGQVSADNKTYTFTLRKGLVYSDGTPVKASDFEYTIERVIKLNWGGKSFFTDYIEGAEDYDEGKANDISGIATDDATGKITITLAKPYGAFANVLAMTSAGFVPSGTPMQNLSNDPPPGVGAYMVTDVVPNKSFSVVKNPKFASLHLPNIPTGHLDRIDVTIQSNPQTEAQQVLNNQADNFDAGDTLPASVVPQIESQAKDRFESIPFPSTFYFFLNTTIPPFNNEMARQAVNTAIDRPALQRLASGFLKVDCYFLPEGIVGHPTAPCPYGPADGHGDIAKAQQLVQQSGTAGQIDHRLGRAARAADAVRRVLRRPAEQDRLQGDSEADLGRDLLPDDREREDRIPDRLRRLDAGLPEPVRLLSAARTRRRFSRVNNENFSNVNDPFIQQQLEKLNPVPATELDSVASQWQALDEYVAKKAYVAVYGSEQVPKFMSDRIDFGTAVFHPTY